MTSHLIVFSLVALALAQICEAKEETELHEGDELAVLRGTRPGIVEENTREEIREAPNYMLDLYERNKYSPVRKGNYRATTVRMINGDIGKVNKDEPRMFLFNLSSVLSSEKILSADLHIYKKEGEGKEIEITIYHINRKYVKYIGHDWLHKKQHGWQILDITAQVKRCVRNRKREHTLGIQLRDAKSKADINLKKFKRKNSRPFVVVYSNDTQNLTVDHIDPRFSPIDLVTLENQLKRNGYIVKEANKDLHINHLLPVDDEVREDENTTFNETNKSDMDKREKRSVVENQVTQLAGRNEKVEAIILPISNGIKFPKPNQFPFSSTDPSILRERKRLRNTKYGDSRYKPIKQRKTIPYPRGFRRKQRRMRRKRRRWNRRNRRQRFDDSLWNDNGVTEPTAVVPSGVCQRHHLRVNFQDIGWNRWIINPKSFDAYYCAGMCPFQKIKSLSPSNHATIQSIVHAVGIHQNIPEPCCVPQSMSSVSLLFFDENDNVVLKNYPGMSVERCACQ